MNVSLLAATQTVEKTMPFVFYRWLVFLGLAIGFVLAALAGAGTAIAVSSFSADPTMFANLGAVLGFAGFAWVLYRFRSTLASEVAHPHLLLIAKVIRGDPIPSGKGQVSYAKQARAERFPAAARPHVLSAKIGATLATLPKICGTSLRPGQTDWRSGMFDRVAAWLSARNTDTVLAQAATDTGHDVWRAAQVAILRQAGVAETYLRQRAYLTVFELIGWAVSFAVLLVPLLKLAAALPFPTTFWPFVLAGVFSWNLKASFLEPISQAAMIRLDQSLCHQEIDPDIAARLADASRDFRDLVGCAGERG